MTTVGELIDELARFPRAAKIKVKLMEFNLIEFEADRRESPADVFEKDAEISNVEAQGCNLNDVRIFI